MGRERHLDRLVHIGPFGVMVKFLGGERNARHEAERRAEIGEREGLRDGVATLHLTPFGRLLKKHRTALEKEGDALLRFLEPDAKSYAIEVS